MTAFATLTWLSARQLRGVALLSAALVATYAAVVTGPSWLADYYLYSGEYTDPAKVVPLLFGAGVAAPLLVREQQRGTVELAYTQSVSRALWLTTRIVPTLVLAVVTYFGVRMVFSLPPGNPVEWSFGLGNVYLRVGYVLFTCALGFCAGAVLGRTVPAMAVTVVGFLLVWLEGALVSLVDVFVSAPVGYRPTSDSPLLWAYAGIPYVFAALLLAVTFGWMTRRVPRR